MHELFHRTRPMTRGVPGPLPPRAGAVTIHASRSVLPVCVSKLTKLQRSSGLCVRERPREVGARLGARGGEGPAPRVPMADGGGDAGGRHPVGGGPRWAARRRGGRGRGRGRRCGACRGCLGWGGLRGARGRGGRGAGRGRGAAPGDDRGNLRNPAGGAPPPPPRPPARPPAPTTPRARSRKGRPDGRGRGGRGQAGMGAAARPYSNVITPVGGSWTGRPPRPVQAPAEGGGG